MERTLDTSLTKKTLVMIVGPSAIGKSTIINEAVRLDPEFGRVSGFTTRQARPNDEPGLYRYVSVDEAERLIRGPAIVQYAIHPQTGAIYGSETKDYPARFNVLDTLANVVEELRALPFERTVTISLTAQPQQWQGWFLGRYPIQSEEADKRLAEATHSIAWSLQDRETYWLENTAGKQDEVAARLIDLIKNPPAARETPPLPPMMLEMIGAGIWS